MQIIISNSSEKPIYEQITTQIKNMIISGELKPGDALPSMRFLAKELHISVITTKRAYEELERLSLDRQKRLEYETRQKNIRDYNSQMKSARIQGEEIGMQKGKQQAEEQILALGKALQRVGRSEEAIKAMTDEKYLKKLLKELGQSFFSWD